NVCLLSRSSDSDASRKGFQSPLLLESEKGPAGPECRDAPFAYGRSARLLLSQKCYSFEGAHDLSGCSANPRWQPVARGTVCACCTAITHASTIGQNHPGAPAAVRRDRF